MSQETGGIFVFWIMIVSSVFRCVSGMVLFLSCGSMAPERLRVLVKL